jgi:Subtilase family
MGLVRLVRAMVGAVVVGACVLASSAAATPSVHGRVRSGPARAGVLLPSSASAVPRYQPGVVLVGLRPGVKSSVLPALTRAVSGRKQRQLGFIGSRTRAARTLQRRIGAAFVVRVPSGTVLSAVAWLRRQRRFVRYAEPNYLMQPAGATTVPNDPSFPLQWGSLNSGQTVNGIAGTAGADDHAAQAWTRSTGSRSIVIGEVDTGVDYNHPDLAANIWSNPGGIGGCAAGTHGYDVLTSTCNPMDTDVSYNGHGTHVAGIMGAVGNNGAGVAGMNWSTTILPVRWVSDDNANNTTSNLITALDWLLKAQQAGVNIRVVNDSTVFIGTAFSQALSDEIDALGANNILFVTAAGNSGQNNDNPQYTRYPCGDDRPTEICVTATNQKDQLPSWANYGPNTVDLAAPGDNIYSTLRNGTYGYISGTSMASPQVAGAAALILSVQNFTAAALKTDILTNVRPVTALTGLVRTGGILDVCQAMPGCSAPPPAVVVPANTGPPVISGTPQAGQTLMASTGQWSNSPTGYTYAWSRCDSTGANCSGVGTNSSSYPVQSTDVGSTLGVAVTASNTAGNSTPASSSPTGVVSSAPTTFGTTSIGGSSDAFSPDRKRVNAYSLIQAGSVSELSVYLQPGYGTGNADIEGVIYADSNGSPGALIATSSQLVFPNTGPAGWYALPFATPPSLAAGRYWIGLLTGGATHAAGYRYASVNASRFLNSNTYTSGPSNPFGSASTDNQQMSLYATYQPG